MGCSGQKQVCQDRSSIRLLYESLVKIRSGLRDPIGVKNGRKQKYLVNLRSFLYFAIVFPDVLENIPGEYTLDLEDKGIFLYMLLGVKNTRPLALY